MTIMTTLVGTPDPDEPSPLILITRDGPRMFTIPRKGEPVRTASLTPPAGRTATGDTEGGALWP